MKNRGDLIKQQEKKIKQQAEQLKQKEDQIKQQGEQLKQQAGLIEQQAQYHNLKQPTNRPPIAHSTCMPRTLYILYAHTCAVHI